MKETKKQLFVQGMKDGIPIGLGYFAVSFTLGIAAKNAGMTALQAAVTSALINASAGEFIGFTLIAANAGYLEVMVMEAVANARYLLMSCALSQKISPSTGLLHRMLMGFYVTDEIFGVSVAQKELKPIYPLKLFKKQHVILWNIRHIKLWHLHIRQSLYMRPDSVPGSHG